jgi:2-keto-3-deoxy-6-phosphogluconate aldolase
MKDTARKKDRRQESTMEELAFAAIADVRATLHEAIVGAGMTVMQALLEVERAELCGARYAHNADRSAMRARAVEQRRAPHDPSRARTPTGPSS